MILNQSQTWKSPAQLSPQSLPALALCENGLGTNFWVFCSLLEERQFPRWLLGSASVTHITFPSLTPTLNRKHYGCPKGKSRQGNPVVLVSRQNFAFHFSHSGCSGLFSKTTRVSFLQPSCVENTAEIYRSVSRSKNYVRSPLSRLTPHGTIGTIC